MTERPPEWVRFKNVDPEPETYQLALDFTARVYTVIELAEGVERFFVRDQLDRRSTAIPVLVSQGLNTEVMHDRRDIYRRARAATRDCLAVLDILSQRGTVECDPLDAARRLARRLIERLDALTIEPHVRG